MTKSFETDHDKQIAIVRLQASNACLALFECCFEDELKHAPYEIVRAWQIGKKVSELVTQK